MTNEKIDIVVFTKNKKWFKRYVEEKFEQLRSGKVSKEQYKYFHNKNSSVIEIEDCSNHKKTIINYYKAFNIDFLKDYKYDKLVIDLETCSYMKIQDLLNNINLNNFSLHSICIEVSEYNTTDIIESLADKTNKINSIKKYLLKKGYSSNTLDNYLLDNKVFYIKKEE